MTKIEFLAGLAALMVVLPMEAGSGYESGRELARTKGCVACHGVDGNGPSPPIPEYPKLAGLAQDYFIKQFEDFASGLRPSEFMKPFATMLDEREIEALAAWFAEQPVRPESPGDPELIALGRSLHFEGNPDTGVPACAGCHGEDARGQPRFPRLAGQFADYAYQQMQRFHSGERDNDLRLAMQRVAARMTDEEMRATAEYHATLE